MFLDFIHSERPEIRNHFPCGTNFLVRQFRMPMEVLAPLNYFMVMVNYVLDQIHLPHPNHKEDSLSRPLTTEIVPRSCHFELRAPLKGRGIAPLLLKRLRMKAHTL